MKKHAQDLYAENYKMVMKGIKEDLSKWRDIPYIGRLDIVEMLMLFKLFYIDLMQLKLQQEFFFFDKCGQAY